MTVVYVAVCVAVGLAGGAGIDWWAWMILAAAKEGQR